MRIMSLADIAKKWLARAQVATSDYEAGCRAPRRPWQEATIDGADAYAAGVQEAIAQGRFQSGVRDVSDAEWLARITDLGVRRWPEGIRVSQPRFTRGFAPYHSALTAATLPPKGPRGSEANYERSAFVGRLLHELRVGGGA